MVTKLERPVRREVRIGQKPYVVTITPDRLRLAIKGRRKGQEILWEDLVGEAEQASGTTPGPVARTPLPRVGATGIPGAR